MIRRETAKPRTEGLIRRGRGETPLDPATGKKKLGRPKGSKNKSAGPLVAQRTLVPGESKISGAQLTKLISSHFHALNHDGEYLDTLASLHPGIYASLVAKVLPQAIAIDITAQVIDLGAAMRESDARLIAFKQSMPQIVEHVAVGLEKPPANSLPHSLPHSLGAKKMAENSEKSEGGLAGGHPDISSGAGVCGPDGDTP